MRFIVLIWAKPPNSLSAKGKINHFSVLPLYIIIIVSSQFTLVFFIICDVLFFFITSQFIVVSKSHVDILNCMRDLFSELNNWNLYNIFIRKKNYWTDLPVFLLENNFILNSKINYI